MEKTNKYKMDFPSEKLNIAKGSLKSPSSSSSTNSSDGTGFVTEKLYMLLQLYLQNKGWNPSLLQCFSELKDSPGLPNAAYLQVLASRIALDSQGRLVLRDTGKIILPFEHFANAVMLKHMSGPHNLHLSVEATVRSVMESYTIGRENFGMERDYIVDVVQNCPSAACRYYKGHLGTPFIDQTFSGTQVNPEYLSHIQSDPGLEYKSPTQSISSSKSSSKSSSQQNIQQQQQQITAAIIQQQNRAIAQQSLEKFGNLTPIEKQRILQQLDKKHYETVAAVAQANNMVVSAQSSLSQSLLHNQSGSGSNSRSMEAALSQHHSQSTAAQSHHHQTNPLQLNLSQLDTSVAKSEFSRPSYDSPTESSYSTSHYPMSNKDELLALHNGAWPANTSTTAENRDGMIVGQDKIIRAFAELMRNMARIKTFIRPSMVKPYGKQSDSLQKTLMDTVLLVQSLRNFLPPPHIQVNSWRVEDRLRKDPESGPIQ